MGRLLQTRHTPKVCTVLPRSRLQVWTHLDQLQVYMQGQVPGPTIRAGRDHGSWPGTLQVSITYRCCNKSLKTVAENIEITTASLANSHYMSLVNVN